ncbi:MAG: hypothetical protein Q9M08_01395 [Mariprofundus sp.]|nr:hypothetical protein [Mariprofundus sp.]
MPENDQSMIIESIRKKQENIAVVIGVVFALTMCVYFFTYAMLVDKGLSGALWIMGLSSVAMLLTLIKLKPVSFFFARLWLGRREDYRDAFSVIAATND